MENQAPNPILIELIRIAPTLVLYLAILIIFLRYRKSFVDGFLPKINTFKAFGFELSLVSEGIENAARSVNKTDVQASPALMQRLSHYPRRPLRLLWVDDQPETVMYEIGILQSLGFMVEPAKTSANALEKLARGQYHLVVSDIRRGDNPTDGLDFLAAMRQRNLHQPVIFYVTHFLRERGVPPYAFGITDDPNELIHLVLDAAERVEG
jgi:CheY-like chemotaxis protein